MGFLDKVKATAQTVADKAQEGVKTGQEKLQDAREKKNLDGNLRDLGAALFLERTGRGTPQLTAEIERLMSEIREQEAGGGVIQPPTAPAPTAASGPEPATSAATAPDAAPVPTPAPDSPPAPPAAPPAAPAGDFNLDDV